MATDNSSGETKQRAKNLAEQIGRYYIRRPKIEFLEKLYIICSNHIETKIDDSVNSTMNIFTSTTGLTPKFKVCMLVCSLCVEYHPQETVSWLLILVTPLNETHFNYFQYITQPIDLLT